MHLCWVAVTYIIAKLTLQKWKELFKNQHGNPPKITDRPIQKSINGQLDIKLKQFTKKRTLRSIKKNQKSEKHQASTKYHLKLRRRENLATNFSVYSFVYKQNFDKHLKKARGHIGRNVVEITIKMKTIVRKPLMIKIKQNSIEKWIKVTSFPRKSDVGIPKNNRSVAIIAIDAQIHNALLLNRIRPKTEKLLWKNLISFRRNRFTTSRVLKIHQIIKGLQPKNLEATLLLIDFSKAFDFINKEKMKQILIAYSHPKEIVTTIMMLYKNTNAMVCLSDGVVAIEKGAFGSPSTTDYKKWPGKKVEFLKEEESRKKLNLSKLNF